MRALASLRRVIRTATPALALGTAALTAAVSACSDTPTSPTSDSAVRLAATSSTRAPAPPPPAALLAALEHPFSASATPNGMVMRGDTVVATVTFDPTVDNQFALGRQGGVQLLAHSVCNPATSGYGPTRWDAPCVPATAPITLSVKVWRGVDGRAIVTFAPDLRFAPALTNWLWVADTGVPKHKDGIIGWCPSTGGVCVDESKSDWSLGTGTLKGTLYRRIKHFSGYTVLVN